MESKSIYNQSTAEFTPIDSKKYNHYTHLHVFLYNKTKQQGKYNYLLHRIKDDTTNIENNIEKQSIDLVNNIAQLSLSPGSGTKFTEIYDSMNTKDASSYFGAARAIINTLRGSLSAKIFEKLNKNEELVPEDILKEELHWYPIWEYPLYYEWLQAITHSNIQYDGLEGRSILFIEVPDFPLDSLNQFLKRQEVPIEYTWMNSETLSTSENVADDTKKLNSLINFDKHIEETLEYIKENNDNLPLYILLACKPKSNSTLDYFYHHLSALFIGIFKRNKEKWVVMNAANDEFPTEEQMKKAKAIIIPGSSVSTYNDFEWIRKTLAWLKEFDANYKDVKFLGACFGAEIIVDALGGKCDMMEQRKTNKYFYLTCTNPLTIDKQFFEYPFVKESGIPITETLNMIESHGDEIVSLPPGFNCLAISPNCKNEIVVSDDGRYFCLQGHPEYTSDFQASRVAGLFAKYSMKTNSLEKIEELRKKSLENDFYKYPNSEYELRALSYHFLKSSIEGIPKSKSNQERSLRQFPY